MSPHAMRHGDLDPHVNVSTGVVVEEALHVHRVLGPGLNEWVYRECLAKRLTKRGLVVEQKVRRAAIFEGERLERAFELDMLVEGTIIVELKAVEEVHPAHYAQLRTYLRLTSCPVGFLINFHAPLLKQGLLRLLNASPTLRRSDPPRESASGRSEQSSCRPQL